MDVREIIKSQYRASLEMLGEAIAKCPDTAWDDPAHKNRYWHVAFHALFFTHLYLQKFEKEFVAWSKHRKEYQFLGPLPWDPSKMPDIGEPYTKEEVLEYLGVCREEVEAKMSQVDVEAESGFSWLLFNKLELQFYNIRHIQHHTGQLADRLRGKVSGFGGWGPGPKRIDFASRSHDYPRVPSTLEETSPSVLLGRADVLGRRPNQVPFRRASTPALPVIRGLKADMR